MTRGRVAAAVLVGVLVVAGCATTVPGQARVSQCGLHDLGNDCEDIRSLPPVSLRDMHVGDRVEHAHRLCGLITDDATSLLGDDNTYQWVDAAGQECVTATEDSTSQVTVRTSLFPQAMGAYSKVTSNTRTTVADRPAWISDTPTGAGRQIRYTISSSGNADSGGVLFIKVELAPPPGVVTTDSPVESDVYTQHPQIANTIASKILST